MTEACECRMGSTMDHGLSIEAQSFNGKAVHNCLLKYTATDSTYRAEVSIQKESQK
jgi:hypothetical protein